MALNLEAEDTPPDPVTWRGQSLASFAESRETQEMPAYYPPTDPSPEGAAGSERSSSKRRNALIGALVAFLVAALGTGGWFWYSQSALASEYESAWSEYETTAQQYHDALVNADALAEQCRATSHDEDTCARLDDAIASAEKAFPTLSKGKAERSALDEVKAATAAGREAIADLSKASKTIEDEIRSGTAEDLRAALVKARAVRAEISDILEWRAPSSRESEEASEYGEDAASASPTTDVIAEFTGEVARLDRYIDQASALLVDGASIGVPEVTQPEAQYDENGQLIASDAQPIVHVDENSGKPASLTEEASLTDAQDLARILADLADTIADEGEQLRATRSSILAEQSAREEARKAREEEAAREAERLQNANRQGTQYQQNTRRRQYDVPSAETPAEDASNGASQGGDGQDGGSQDGQDGQGGQGGGQGGQDSDSQGGQGGDIPSGDADAVTPGA